MTNGYRKKPGHRRDRISWTPAEDATLRACVAADMRWPSIAAELPGRTPAACQKRANGLGLMTTRAAADIAIALETSKRVARDNEARARAAAIVRGTNRDVDGGRGSRD